jgi:hypothetical protein
MGEDTKAERYLSLGEVGEGLCAVGKAPCFPVTLNLFQGLTFLATSAYDCN